MCKAYINFKVQLNIKNFFRPRLNFFNSSISCTLEISDAWQQMHQLVRRVTVYSYILTSYFKIITKHTSLFTTHTSFFTTYTSLFTTYTFLFTTYTLLSDRFNDYSTRFSDYLIRSSSSKTDIIQILDFIWMTHQKWSIFEIDMFFEADLNYILNLKHFIKVFII